MQLDDIKKFLDNMYNSYEEFQYVNGVSNSIDSKYMLIADVLSEDTELFASVINERLLSTAVSSMDMNLYNNSFNRRF